MKKLHGLKTKSGVQAGAKPFCTDCEDGYKTCYDAHGNFSYAAQCFNIDLGGVDPIDPNIVFS